MANYEIWYCDDLGNRIAPINNVIQFEYTKVAGDVGKMSLTVPIQGKIWEQEKVDYRVHIYRQPINGSMSLEFVAFLQVFIPKTEKNGLATYTLIGECANTLYTRRIIAYDSEDSKSLYSGSYTSNMMRSIYSNNFGGGATAARQLSSSYIGAAANIEQGGAYSKRAAWQKSLDLLQNMQATSKSGGSEVFWAIVPINDTKLEFQTYPTQLGANKTNVVFSLEYGNLTEPQLIYDYSDMKTYIYVGGKGRGASRDIEEVEDTTRSGLSFWGRRESFRNATFADIGDTSALNDVGQDELAKYRQKKSLVCGLIDTPSTRYGREWNFGDKVTINYQGVQAETIIRAVNVKVDSSGRETIAARAEIEL